MSDTIYRAAAIILPLVFAIVFHEVAHGWAARYFGDPTASRLGRLTLNPIKHVDPVGTILLPGALALMGMPVFGWAKPVPVNTAMLRNPRVHMMAVAAAGPAMNLLLALVAAILLGLVAASSGANGMVQGSAVIQFIAYSVMSFLTINVFLALFNLLPIPPFDGSHIVEGLLPDEMAAAYARMRNAGFAIVLVLLVVLPQVFPSFNPIGWLVEPPVNWLLDKYLIVTKMIAGG